MNENESLNSEEKGSRKKNNTVPTTLFQLLVYGLRSFVIGLPKRLVWAIITALVVFVFHTYLMVVVNEGFNIDQNSLLKYILVVGHDTYNSNFINSIRAIDVTIFWTLLPIVFWGTIGQIRRLGFKVFIVNLSKNSFQLLLEIFEKPGSFLLTLFLGAICIGLFCGIIIGNPFTALLLSIVIFLSICARGNSLIILVSYLSWGDFQRFFRINPKKAFYIDIVGMVFRGISLGLFLFCLMPFAKVTNIIQYVILLAFFILFLLNIIFRKKKQIASFLLFFGGTLFLSSIKVQADDGGWSESGGNFLAWIKSEGAIESLKRGAGPALGALSMALGFVPVLGDIKDAQEALTGTDYITGEKLSAIERLLTLVAVAVPVVNGKLLREGFKVGEEAVELGGKLAHMDIPHKIDYNAPTEILGGNYSASIAQTATHMLNNDFVEFASKSDAETWGKNAFDPWVKSLSQDERRAIYDYTGYEYHRNINSVLRGLEPVFAEGNVNRVNQITEALNKSCVTENITVYRGVDKVALGAYKDSPQRLIGQTITDKGFMSTSLSPEGAFDGPVNYIIQVPKGTSGAYVGDISQWGHKEAELLLNREQDMFVTDVKFDVDGKTYIYCSILH